MKINQNGSTLEWHSDAIVIGLTCQTTTILLYVTCVCLCGCYDGSTHGHEVFYCAEPAVYESKVTRHIHMHLYMRPFMNQHYMNETEQKQMWEQIE